MKWFMFQIRGVERGGRYRYFSHFMEREDSSLLSKEFENESELSRVLKEIFVGQNRPRELQYLLEAIRSGGRMWFGKQDDSDMQHEIRLTEEQAGLLGWVRNKQQ